MITFHFHLLPQYKYELFHIYFTVKILFDSGSQRSYVTDSLKSRLGLRSKETETLHLNTFGEKKFRKQKCDVVTLLLDDLDNEPSKISVLSFPTICSALPSRVNASHYPHLNGLHLADCSNPQHSIDYPYRI